MGFSVGTFLHDALYHLPVELFDLDHEWRKKYAAPPENAAPEELVVDPRLFFT
jgi:hypothetical protein